MGEEEIEELMEKPESMLSAKVQQVLIQVINSQTEKALKQGDNALAMELQRAKKLLKKGCWTVRKSNPFIYFLSDCLKGKGGNLKATQEAMQKCSIDWKKLSEQKKREYRAKAGKLGIYDYL